MLAQQSPDVWLEPPGGGCEQGQPWPPAKQEASACLTGKTEAGAAREHGCVNELLPPAGSAWGPSARHRGITPQVGTVLHLSCTSHGLAGTSSASSLTSQANSQKVLCADA